MRISLVQISLVPTSLLPFFKSFHKYLPYADFGLFISLLRIFGKCKIWLIQLFHSPISQEPFV